MRGLLIFVWLFVAGLTAFSAFKYKSQSIEDDITARTTKKLGSEVLEVASLDVDGRHVTLKGVVASQEVKAGYLETADETFGALGPIDGLIVSSSQPFLSAIKSQNGVILRGVVESEDVKSEIVERASAFAENGSVDNKLTVAPNIGSLPSGLVAGLGQLSGLSSGQYLATGDSETLSGTAQNKAAFTEISTFGTDRANWTSTVAEPVDTAAFQSQIADLDAKASGLETELASVTADFGSFKASSDDSHAAKNAKISDLESELSQKLASGGELAVLNASLSEQTETLGAELTAEKDKVAQLEENISEQKTINQDLKTRNADLTQENAELGEELTKTVAVVSQKDAQITDLTGQVAGLNADLEKTTASDSELSVLNETLSAEVEQLKSVAAEQNAAMSTQLEQVQTLTSNVAERDVQIDILLAERQTAEAQIDVLTSEKSALDSEIATLKSSQTGSQAEYAALVETRDRFAANLATLTGQKAVLDEELAATKADLTASKTQIASLEADLTAEQQKLATAMAAPASSAGLDLTVLSGQCSDAAQRILEDGKINFVTGTAQFTQASAPIVERMTGIVLACAGDGLQVEVGGHTDARGDDSANQALSEARANTIRDYMVARGVEASNLTAVGYGETQPIATNDTSEGMSQNRRISFDWRAN